MPVIQVQLFEGRTVEQKRALVRELTDALVRTCGGNAAAVHVVIQDVKKENWGAGGALCSDTFAD
ncbi:MAG: 4-oxalocrotonate tautomerase [Pseudomonadota bacterium]